MNVILSLQNRHSLRLLRVFLRIEIHWSLIIYGPPYLHYPLFTAKFLKGCVGFWELF